MCMAERRRHRVALAWACLLAVPAAGGLRAADVRTIDARTLAGRVVAISADELRLKADDKVRSIPRDEVAVVALGGSRDPLGARGEDVLTTTAGDVLLVRALRLADNVLSFDTPLADGVTLKLNAARRLYLPGPARAVGFVRSEIARLKLPEPNRDTLIVQQEKGRLMPVEGLLVAIGPEKITFRWQDADRTIDRSEVRAVRLPEVSKPPPSPAGVLIGRQGCRLAFASLTFDGKSFVVGTFAAGRIEIPTARVAEVRFRSKRVTPLVDLKPTAVREVPFFDMKFPHRVNRSVGGGPLRLAGETYDEGLGLHSLCELTYELDGAYRLLVAKVGIDDAVRPAGSAALTVLGDGKPLGEPLTLTGRGPPADLRIDVRGVKRLVVRVGYGPDGIDAADHVDLIAPRLVK
jgi:hypothetical protein